MEKSFFQMIPKLFQQQQIIKILHLQNQKVFLLSHNQKYM